MADSGASNLLKRVGTAVVLVPIVLVLILWAPIWVLAGVAGLVGLLAIHEFLKLSEHYNVRPFRLPSYIYAGLFFLAIAIASGMEKPLVSTAAFIYGTAFAAALAPFVFLTMGMTRNSLREALPAAAMSTVAFSYIALPMGFLVQLRQQWAGAFYVFYLLLIVWAGDIFAYFVGSSTGRHRMSPRVSPKKTWEGAAASVIASVGIGVLIFSYARQISQFFLSLHLIQPRDGMLTYQHPPLLPIVVLSAIINVAAQLGDLVESVIKRGADVKDSGALLPGHGGMLDRIDALLFAAPVLWYYAAIRVLQ
ncbi:MAG TPA: phosphatidate cytidylyltransferase [Terriglobales bacterium]|nr:phosphatidate cytidylyltransferase [Terriglobales bacterium]